jgi:hypothetical protein
VNLHNSTLFLWGWPERTWLSALRFGGVNPKELSGKKSAFIRVHPRLKTLICLRTKEATSD